MAEIEVDLPDGLEQQMREMGLSPSDLLQQAVLDHVADRNAREAMARALLRLGEINRDLKELAGRLDDAAAAARVTGASWEVIGGVVGLSRQAARERFDKSGE